MSEPNQTPKARTVLCIEDEHFISELYVRALKEAGYEPTVVYDGKQGLDAAVSGKYDIILLDLMIPTITGMEVLRTLRAPNDQPVKSKIIIATNLDVPEAARTELEKMADGYFIKAEITPKQLVRFLDQIKL